ncbi:MAG TPA: 30S ribosomal protein S6 [Ktedonobacterales bacterium]|jgi:small subunit ribosomal protein S6|nr:30S ribosomal protein S6 [Ktedonobacterales bacterium]
MARDYELGIVINPEAGDEQARAIVERVAQTITNNSGQVVRVNAWGRRRLAYPIQRFRDGLYFFFDLILEPSTIAEIERTLRLNEDIIRHLMKVRDPRVVAQQRQRDVELDAQREAEAKAQAEAEAARAEAAANAPAAEATEATEVEEPAQAEEAAPATTEAATAETATTGGDTPAAVSETAQAEA